MRLAALTITLTQTTVRPTHPRGENGGSRLKGTDLSRPSAHDLAAVAATLNARPRKTLGWRTPAEALHEYLTTTG